MSSLQKCMGDVGLVWAEIKNTTHTLPITQQLCLADGYRDVGTAGGVCRVQPPRLFHVHILVYFHEHNWAKYE